MSEVQIRKGISMEEELRILRRSVQDRIHSPSALSVINKIVANQPVSLECFRSLPEKESLLDEAIASGNGDAILAVRMQMYHTRLLVNKRHFRLSCSFGERLNDRW